MVYESPRRVLFEFRGDVLSVLFVALKDLQAGREQVFKFRIAGVRNKRALQRRIDGPMIRYFVVDVGLVEVLAAELGEFGPLIGRLFAQCFAGVVIFWGYAELFHQRQRLLVHRFVISLHVGREREDVLILALLLGLRGS